MNDMTALGAMPEWDLSHLYPGMESPELRNDLQRMAREAKGFAERYEGRLDGLDGDALAAAIAEYERIDDILGRMMSYAYLLYAADMNDTRVGQFFQTLQERVNDITAHTLFFTLELNRVEEAVLDGKLASPALRHYAPWLRDVRAFRPHQLGDELEKLLHEKAVTGRGSWVRLYDETLAGLRFPVGERELTLEQALHLMSEPDGETRKAAAKSLGTVLAGNVKVFSLVLNTIAKDKEVEDKWRRFAGPADARHLGNHVEPEVVAALAEAVREAYPRLSHRYYALKARWMGVGKLEYWDRNAPLPGVEDRTYTWEEAREVVLGAYRRFSPELAGIGARFFENRWIDAPARPGKATGAFSHPTVPSAHPYLLLNYQGRTRDVMTLAHELGHGVHQVLAAPRGPLMADTPLILAETASVFGEQLTFRALLDAETDPARRRTMLVAKVEDMLNTVVRQIAFYDFEHRFHAERRQGEITAERIGEIWLDVQQGSLGPAFHFDPEYRHFWTYISHFFHSPFYVYAYAFGDCLVNALYAVYQDAGQGFQDKYLEMLRAGGTLRHKELLAPFRLDAGDPGFWAKGLGIISGFIDQLEAEG